MYLVANYKMDFWNELALTFEALIFYIWTPWWALGTCQYVCVDSQHFIASLYSWKHPNKATGTNKSWEVWLHMADYSNAIHTTCSRNSISTWANTSTVNDSTLCCMSSHLLSVESPSDVWLFSQKEGSRTEEGRKKNCSCFFFGCSWLKFLIVVHEAKSPLRANLAKYFLKPSHFPIKVRSPTGLQTC